MTRRTRVDSTAAAVKIAKAANKPIEPPSSVPLSAGDLPFFENIISEFARSEWTAHQLEMAAKLARLLSDHETDELLLREEGSVIEQEGGKLVANPREGVVNRQRTAILAWRRNMSLHARAKEGEARDVGARRDAIKEVEGALGGDDLLARPN